MTAENLTRYLQDPALLPQLGYQELKTLVVRYPFCQNLRLLLALKSQMDHHREADRQLKMAAIAVPDRKKLYHLIRQYQMEEIVSDNYLLNEEYLELKDLSEPDLSVDSLFERPETAPADPSGPPPKSPPVWQSTISDAAAIASITAQWSPILPQASNSKNATELSNQSSEAMASQPQPTPKSSFRSWLQQFQSPQVNLQLDYLMEAGYGKAQKKQESNKQRSQNGKLDPEVIKAKRLARKSIQESGEIASETLALLLEKQGYAEKAIAMYERLRLIFPEKSPFFAEKISNLKRNLR
jgi:hypothetical protein